MAYVGGTPDANVSSDQAQKLWIAAGGDPAQANTAAAIATAESSLVPNNWNTADPAGGSFGLWQINGVHATALAQAGLTNWQTDPLQNAQAAVLVSNNGANWRPWSTYTSGAYQKYLGGTVSSAVQKFVVGDSTPGSAASTVYGQNLAQSSKTPSTGTQTASAATSGGGFNAADPFGIGAAFDRAIAAANTIATEVFLGALALALVSGGILWLASTDSTVRAAVKATAV